MNEPFAFHAPLPDIEERADGHFVKLRVPQETELTAAWVRSEPDNEEHLSPLRPLSPEGRWTLWEGRLRLNPAAEVTLYAFKMIVNGRQWWLSGGGLTPYFPERDVHFRFVPTYEPARWVWSQVFYQIFPERFFDGDPANNVRSGEYLYEGKPVVAKPWGELPERSQGPQEFYGGDLEGVRQKLPYLQALGVTALYLNPVFTSPSSHKYDTSNYEHVDPHFGGDEALAALCDDLRARNMRIILDAVVNHTSERHPWFDRHSENRGEHEAGAYSGEASPTRGFYTFRDAGDPDSYVGWYDVRTLPVLDFAHPGVRARVFEADDAVLRRWLRPPYSADGWRFDVIHMLGEGEGARNNADYVRHFRRTLREENPQAYVLGEHFFEATAWLQGDQEDGAMNYYGFGLPVRAFLAGVDHREHPIEVDAADLGHMLTRARARLPFPVQLSQFNLLGSHDTSRFLTAVGGDRALMKLGVTLLFTYIGVPCVYYGDEVGLEGGHDPDCRRTFPWDESVWDEELLEHTRTLIRFRHEQKALQEGAFVTLYAAGNVFAFGRVLHEEIVVVAVNRGAEAVVNLPVWRLGLKDETLRSLFDGEDATVHADELTLTLEPKSSQVYVVSSSQGRAPTPASVAARS